MVPLLPSTDQDFGNKHSINSIDTFVATYELSSKSEKMHLFEGWLLKDHKVSSKRLRVIYLRYKTLVDRIFQLRSMLSCLLNAFHDYNLPIQVHNKHEALKVLLIYNTLLQSRWLLSVCKLVQVCISMVSYNRHIS